MTPTLWDLPGARRWMDTVLSNVTDGRPVILACPHQATPTHLCAHLTETLTERSRLDVEQLPVALGEDHSSTELPAAVADDLGLARNRSARFGPDSFASHPDLHDTVCLIDARDSTTAVADRWCEFAAALADAAQAVPVHDRARLVVVIDGKAATVVPEPDPNIAITWWWGVLTPLDIAVYIDHHALGAATAAEVVEVGRWDLDLVDDLVISRLSAVPKPGERPDLDAGRYGTRAPDNPTTVLDAWSAGLVEAWDGYLDHHVSLAGDIDRRVWLAQVRTLFPWLERLRLELVARVSEAARRNGLEPRGLDGMELSHLKGWIFDQQVFLARQDYNLLCQAVRARHSLAHLDPIEARSISDLERMAISAGIHARLR